MSDFKIEVGFETIPLLIIGDNDQEILRLDKAGRLTLDPQNVDAAARLFVEMVEALLAENNRFSYSEPASVGG